MRYIDTEKITQAVERLITDANHFLPHDVVKALKEAAEAEKNKKAKNILYKIIENHKTSKKGVYPLCQDTGIAVVFLTLGAEVIVKGDLKDAVNKGVAAAAKGAYLRRSVADPVSRGNTGNNTPAIIHMDTAPGVKLKIQVMSKGAGAENKSKLAMLNPSDGMEGVKKFVLDTVKAAGASACPPYIIGVGIGGNFETAPLLAKKALMREMDDKNRDLKLKALEKELLSEINKLGIGPLGLGGATTAIAVKIEKLPCHIASLPVAVNVQCHSARHKEIIL